MTKRLYYPDSYLRDFEAKVLEVRTREQDTMVLLDRTAFYPTSGGQPYDQGWLGVARVVEVSEDEDGNILHHIEGDLVPGPVAGTVDWDRRFDHMQQHTGQHLLSQAFLRVAAASTLSFHLGRESSTIDIEIGDVSEEQVAAVEDEANRVIFENRPVVVRFVPPGEVESLQLRKEPVRSGELRIVEIEDYDRSACGGTHLRHTGELGLVVVTATERYKSNIRVEFLCGWRALRRFRSHNRILQGLNRRLSTGSPELSESVQKLLDDNRELSRRVRDLTGRVNEFEAELLFQTAEKRDGILVVQAAVGDYPTGELKMLASRVMKKGPCVVMIATTGKTSAVVLGNSSERTVDSGKVLAEILDVFGGRGGGRPELAQGGGFPGERAGEFLERLSSVLFPVGPTWPAGGKA